MNISKIKNLSELIVVTGGPIDSEYVTTMDGLHGDVAMFDKSDGVTIDDFEYICFDEINDIEIISDLPKSAFNSLTCETDEECLKRINAGLPQKKYDLDEIKKELIFYVKTNIENKNA